MTLELALSGVPMVTAYRTGSVEAWILRRAIKVNSVILANLVIGENVIPEFLQEDCTPEKLAQALREVLGDSALRRKQIEAFAKIDQIMSTGNQPPSARAADIVLATMRKARRLSMIGKVGTGFPEKIMLKSKNYAIEELGHSQAELAELGSRSRASEL